MSSVYWKIQSKFHTAALDVFDLFLNHFVRKTKFRNSEPQHSSSCGLGLKDRDRISHFRQEVGTGQAGGPRANHSNSLILGHWKGFPGFADMLKIPVSCKTLQGTNCDRIIQLTAATLEFTRMYTDSSAYRRKRIPLANNLRGLFIIPGRNGGHVVGHINACWTGVLAGRDDHGITGGSGASVL